MAYGPGDVLGWGDKKKRDFPDPWQTYSAHELPRTLSDIFDWCEAIWYRNSTYQMAMKRVVSYFLTDIEVSDVGDDEIDKYRDYYENDVNLLGQAQAVAEDFLAYGNAFISLHFPFDRFIQCEVCAFTTPMLSIDFKFEISGAKLHAECPHCRRTTTWKHSDRLAVDDDSVKLVRWGVRDTDLQMNPLTGQAQYWTEPPNAVKQGVKDKDRFILSTTPWEVIKCITEGKRLRMHPDQFFHLKEPTLCGIENRGWGIPRIVSNMPQAYYVQVLKRLNEAQALDWIMPVRIMSPSAPNQGDPFSGQNLAMYKSQVTNAVKQSRFDPASFSFLPFPVQYQAIGGEGLQLATHQLIDAATDEMLNGSGVPAELYRGTMQLQAMPTALRLFHQTWRPFCTQINDMLNWVGKMTAERKNWDKPRVKLQESTMAYDLELKQLLVSLWGAQQVSAQTALSPLGIDSRREAARVMDELKHKSELEKDFQRDQMEQQKAEEQIAALEMAQQPMPMGGMGAPTGAPMGGPGGIGAPVPQAMAGMPPTAAAPTSGAQTPMDMMAQADQMAQQLVQIPYPQRRQQLTDMKHNNPALHAIVTQKMEDLRQQVASEAKMSLSQGM